MAARGAGLPAEKARAHCDKKIAGGVVARIEVYDCKGITDVDTAALLQSAKGDIERFLGGEGQWAYLVTGPGGFTMQWLGSEEVLYTTMDAVPVEIISRDDMRQGEALPDLRGVDSKPLGGQHSLTRGSAAGKYCGAFEETRLRGGFRVFWVGHAVATGEADNAMDALVDGLEVSGPGAIDAVMQ